MKKLLIIDDDTDTLNALKTHFERANYEVRASDNAHEVLQLLKNFAPGVLITDWKLGGDIDGVDLANIISKAVSDVEIIFITGHDIEQLENELSCIQVKQIIRKPFEFAAIDAAIADKRPI